MAEPMSAEVLRRAAARRDAPERLLRVADAVLEGKFTWAEVASGATDHPLAVLLFTPKAHETLWPLLQQVAAELDAPPACDQPPGAGEPEDDFSHATVLRDSFDVTDERW
ncbi:hypothetical protein [Labedaea rhizosphaerae]|uniref:Uncharacterized protein n=1 Tax=Labedaea rhizosphaerae TaxID=598644 RepID=A0A4R6RZW8_LABRH|nr:hypothetical protein [Labedaea rhizosphaerae]TDP91865.1 hypothetical protein EV186_10875 [Labedaea rhizosphaerae]